MRLYLIAMMVMIFSVGLSGSALAQTTLFGGRVLSFTCPFGIFGVCPCYNGLAAYVLVGPPKSGAFVWTPATRTYPSGPPGRIGQYVVGRASVPYYCVASIFPLIVIPGKHMDFVGSSGPPAVRPTFASTTPVALWKYPQFTSAVEYDAEEDRLESDYKRCTSAKQEPCNQHVLATGVRQEREKRFGARP